MKQIYKYLLLFFVCTTLHAQTYDPYPFQSQQEAQQFKQILNEIRCVVCQNQSLGESSAPLANDLRQKIYLMIKTKKSNAEIKDYLVKRYGEFILLRPLVNKNNFFLWSFPFIGLIIILLIFFKLIKPNLFKA